jgi:hypothetical protein
MVWVPNHDRFQKNTHALPARAPYPHFGEEHNHDVDYNADSSNDDGSTILEGPAESNEDQGEPSGNGKDEAEPKAVVGLVLPPLRNATQS